MLKDPTVRFKKKTALLDLFSILRVYEQVVFLSRLHNRQVWSHPGIPPFPPPTLLKAEVRPPKITDSVKGMERRTLTHPLCYEVLET